MLWYHLLSILLLAEPSLTSHPSTCTLVYKRSTLLLYLADLPETQEHANCILSIGMSNIPSSVRCFSTWPIFFGEFSFVLHLVTKLLRSTHTYQLENMSVQSKRSSAPGFCSRVLKMKLATTPIAESNYSVRCLTCLHQARTPKGMAKANWVSLYKLYLVKLVPKSWGHLSHLPFEKACKRM